MVHGALIKSVFAVDSRTVVLNNKKDYGSGGTGNSDYLGRQGSACYSITRVQDAQ